MYFEIDAEWKSMYCQAGPTGMELAVRVICDEVVSDEMIWKNVLKKLDADLHSDGMYYFVEMPDEDTERFLKTDVVDVIRRKVVVGLQSRGKNYEMKFSIKFDNQGWWPDD